MDVSNGIKNPSTSGTPETTVGGDTLDGSLIDQLISLTGIPAPALHQQLDEILDTAGQKSDGLTLEQLREAMLTYLMTLESEAPEALD